MPRYKVLENCFFEGVLYGPGGKRPVYHKGEPFPTVNKKEQVPPSLRRIKEETAAQKKKRESDAAAQAKLDAEKTAEDKKETDAVTFVEPPRTTAVETL